MTFLPDSSQHSSPGTKSQLQSRFGNQVSLLVLQSGNLKFIRQETPKLESLTLQETYVNLVQNKSQTTSTNFMLHLSFYFLQCQLCQSEISSCSVFQYGKLFILIAAFSTSRHKTHWNFHSRLTFNDEQWFFQYNMTVFIYSKTQIFSFLSL